MFEPLTFDVILKEMLERVPEDMDKREGSVLWNALAPAAAELQNAYIQMDMILDQTFADTSEFEYLERRCGERGITRFPATKAVLKGEFNIDIPLGSRFSLDAFNYIAKKKISDGVYQMECETAGSEGNSYFGKLIPIDYIKGLTWGKLTELLIPGEDIENDESLRKRYYQSLNSQAYGGNIEDYKQKVNALPGVGGVKVYPVWKGGGTVKLVIISSAYDVPTQELIDTIQTEIDPVPNNGKGMGIAPIGHVVTVEGVKKTTIDFKSKILFKEGWDFESAKSYIENLIDAYFQDLAEKWAEDDYTIVRISQIESRILEFDQIVDVGDSTLNGVASNFVLQADCIPVRGEVGVIA